MQLITARKLNHYSVLMAAVIAVVVSVAAGAQPELEVTPGPSAVSVGEAFRITCEVSWSGSPDDYIVLLAEMEPLEWGDVTLLPSMAFVRDGRNVIVQTVEIVAKQVGEVEVPAILIPYLRPEDIQKPEKPDTPMHLNASDAPPKLRADPFPLLVQPHTTPAWLFGVLGALFFCALAFLGWRFRSRRGIEVTPVDSHGHIDNAAVNRYLEQAKRKRLEGEFYGAYRDMAAAAELLKARDPDLAARLTARAQEIGYRSIRPTDDEMDSDFRTIDRILALEDSVAGV
jgi:hypothetical protein